MRYKPFGKHTGLRVSELVLGTGTFGTGWGHGAEPDEAKRMFDAYADAGGNFIDTADTYQGGQSEEILGNLLGRRRQDFVLATKFSMGSSPEAGILGTGNSRRAMVASVEASLKRLKTDWIDVYWVHLPDNVTPMEEIVRGFDDLARSGKVLYAGLSDFPAWRVSYAAAVAELRGALPIAGLQVEHSLLQRTTEYELLPAGEALGLGIVAWSPLGGGVLTGKYRRGETGRAEGFGGRLIHPENTAQRTAILDALIATADEIGVTPGQVAIAWVAAKGALPIIGPRTLAQAQDNLAAVSVTLSAEHIERLDRASAIPAIFPYSLTNESSTRNRVTGGKLQDFDGPRHPII